MLDWLSGMALVGATQWVLWAGAIGSVVLWAKGIEVEE